MAGGGGGGERRGEGNGVAGEPRDGNAAGRGNGAPKGEESDPRGTGVRGGGPGAADESMLGSDARVAAMNGVRSGLSNANSRVASGRS